MNYKLSLRALAEFLGTGFLVAAVVGSGIMAERLFNGNTGLALLANTLATGAVLVALILTFTPVSGAHLNPAVSLSQALQGSLGWMDLPVYVSAQFAGGVFGTLLAHGMFGLTLIRASQHTRSGAAQWLSEFVATFGLLLVIWGSSQSKGVAYAVASYITAAYWFTASTSFANPAVTIARSLSDTFAGIRPADVPLFLSAQFAGALCVTMLSRLYGLRPSRAIAHTAAQIIRR
jgi:glycerol uptake facilitator-like aquaporin